MPLVNVTERLRVVMGLLEPVWEAAARRNAWFAGVSGRSPPPEGMPAGAAGWSNAAAGKAALVWSTVEPFAMTVPLHGPHNRNITHLNAEARQARGSALRARIPLLYCAGRVPRPASRVLLSP